LAVSVMPPDPTGAPLKNRLGGERGILEVGSAHIALDAYDPARPELNVASGLAAADDVGGAQRDEDRGLIGVEIGARTGRIGILVRPRTADIDARIASAPREGGRRHHGRLERHVRSFGRSGGDHRGGDECARKEDFHMAPTDNGPQITDFTTSQHAAAALDVTI